MHLATAINQGINCHSLDELKQNITSIVQTINMLPFLSGELRQKVQFYQQKLNACQHEDDFFILCQNLLADFNSHETGSLGLLIADMTKSWGAKLILRQLGLKKGHDPMMFIRSKFYKILANMGLVEICIQKARKGVVVAL